MSRYQRFSNFVELVALFIALFLADQAIKLWQSLNLPAFLAVTVRGLSALFFLHASEFFTTYLFNSFSLARRLALGDEFLEGIWFDVVENSPLCGLLSISYQDGRLRMNGEQYDVAGNLTASWDNFLVSEEGRTLRTLYRSPQFHQTQPSELLGFSTYVFSGSPGKAPDRYSGYFADSSAPGHVCALRGYRITDKQVLERLRSPTLRTQALASIYESIRGGA